jgi:hypothetical protein
MMTLMNIATDKQPFKPHENANLATFVKVQHDAIAE